MIGMISIHRLYNSHFWCWLWLAGLVLSPLFYVAMLNWIGPSTEYHDPSLPTAERCDDQHQHRWCVYLGDEFYVNITVVRHALNGNCLFDIRRYFERIDGEDDGRRHLVSHTQLQFVGQNELRRARWPSPPDKYILGYEVDDNNVEQLDKPLLKPGQDEQEFIAYVQGRYYCNFIDYIIPRYIQGGERPNQTARVRFTLRRRR